MKYSSNFQLYIWLEREVEALKQLCNYGAGVAREESADQQVSDDRKMPKASELLKFF